MRLEWRRKFWNLRLCRLRVVPIALYDALFVFVVRCWVAPSILGLEGYFEDLSSFLLKVKCSGEVCWVLQQPGLVPPAVERPLALDCPTPPPSQDTDVLPLDRCPPCSVPSPSPKLTLPPGSWYPPPVPGNRPSHKTAKRSDRLRVLLPNDEPLSHTTS